MNAENSKKYSGGGNLYNRIKSMPKHYLLEGICDSERPTPRFPRRTPEELEQDFAVDFDE